VLAAVHLNNQPLFSTNKIADILIDRLLPYEFVASDLTIADAIPECSLRVRLIGTQPPRDPDRFVI
jgi:hypothetical protein